MACCCNSELASARVMASRVGDHELLEQPAAPAIAAITTAHGQRRDQPASERETDMARLRRKRLGERPQARPRIAAGSSNRAARPAKSHRPSASQCESAAPSVVPAARSDRDDRYTRRGRLVCMVLGDPITYRSLGVRWERRPVGGGAAAAAHARPDN